MDVMDIFEDYDSFLKENYDLIKLLVAKKSKSIQRFAHVFVVTNYLYEEHLNRELTEDEGIFFSTGFDYIFDQFTLIKTIYEETFDKKIDEMEKISQTINLLLYIHEFQGEALNFENLTKKDLEELDDLEDSVNQYIDKHENAPDEFFPILNEITEKLFEEKNLEVHTIEEIFYEIAVEYDLYDDDEFDLYNTVLNAQIAKTRK